MTTPSVSLSSARDRRVALLGTVGFAAVLAAASHVAIPVPGTPVPITLQPLVVPLAGLFLGPVYGTASMLLYIALGAAGLPVWAPMGAPGVARLLGPTGGYILAYPVAACLAGALGARARGWLARSLAALAGLAVSHVGGLLQLTILTGGVASAVALGVKPFALLDVVKAGVAGLLAPRTARPARGARLDG